MTSLQKNLHSKLYPGCRNPLRIVNDTKGAFRFSISLTGAAIEQFEQYVPNSSTSCAQARRHRQVEFLAAPYAHPGFALRPREFRNRPKYSATNYIRSSARSQSIPQHRAYLLRRYRSCGFMQWDSRAALPKAPSILGWKSPDYIYSAASAPSSSSCSKDDKLSDDIAFRFSDSNWDAYPSPPTSTWTGLLLLRPKNRSSTSALIWRHSAPCSPLRQAYSSSSKLCPALPTNAA